MDLPRNVIQGASGGLVAGALIGLAEAMWLLGSTGAPRVAVGDPGRPEPGSHRLNPELDSRLFGHVRPLPDRFHHRYRSATQSDG